jgi:Holliday junction DNA helicase RuvA
VIARLQGRLDDVTDDRAYVEAGAMTFELLVPAADVEQLRGRIGQDVTFFTVFYMEGEASGGNLTPRLVGFASEADRGFFHAFITVKGIGPRKALRALAVPPAEVAASIESKDARGLTKLPQIGKRAAETIIAELAGKVGRFVTGDVPPPVAPKVATAATTPEEVDAIDALVQLGERRADAETLLERAKAIEPKPEGVDGLIRQMLSLRRGG